jgi:hypothetical protein
LIVEITPLGILAMNEPDFPGARPMFEVLFPLNGGQNRFMMLDVNELVQSIPLAEAFDQALAMFPRTAGQISGDADLQHAIGTVGHDVDPRALLAHQGP